MVSQDPGQGQEQGLGQDTLEEAVEHSTPGSGSSRPGSVMVSIQQVVDFFTSYECGPLVGGTPVVVINHSMAIWPEVRDSLATGHVLIMNGWL